MNAVKLCEQILLSIAAYRNDEPFVLNVIQAAMLRYVVAFRCYDSSLEVFIVKINI